MPNLEHESPLDLIRYHPDLAAQLFGHASGGPPPKYARARCDAAEATTAPPIELRADSVIVLDAVAGGDGATADAPAMAIVVESQTGYDTRKRFTWPAYVANIRARLRCPVVLLVLIPERSIAQWCAEEIDLGFRYFVHRPLVLALDTLEPVTDEAAIRANPEVAALAIPNRPDDRATLDTLRPTLNALDPSVAGKYADYVLAALPAAARKYLEDQMLTDYEYKSDFAKRYFGEGLAEGKAEAAAGAVLAVLDSRHLTIPDHVRERVTTCQDPAELSGWIRRAAVVDHADDIFD